MLVWSDGLKDSAVLAKVLYVNPIYIFVSVLQDNGHIAVFDHCALLPDHPLKPRRATWLEVARWCATGKGLVYDTYRDKIDTGIMFKPSNEHEQIMDEIRVRKWSDTEWHEPDVFYMEIEKENT